MIAAILVILVLPSLFFTYIGHEPMKEQVKATRQIAVVNEDNGSNFEKKPINFVHRILPALEKDSDYQWEVVSRSSAEKGLADQRYDAVVYFPSDFSKNILTFEQNSPVKASVSYNLQVNLDAKNKEKLQRELEITKGNMNKQITSLYWSVVSQSVEDIRKKFDKILEKEIAFQNTIYSFYNPNSEKLASEIEQQRKMINDLFSSTRDAEKASAASMDSFNANKKEIAAFVDSINKYKEYQQRQDELFTMTAAENEKMMQDGLGNYETVINNSVQAVADRQNVPDGDLKGEDLELKEKMAGLKSKITESTDKLDKLTASLNDSTVDQQFEKLASIQRELVHQYKQDSGSSALDSIQMELIPARQKLQSPGSDPENNPEPPPSGGDPNTDAIMSAITEAKKQAEKLKAQLEAAQSAKQAQPALKTSEQAQDQSQPVSQSQPSIENWDEINASLQAVTSGMQQIESGVQQQTKKQEELQKAYNSLIKQLQDQDQGSTAAEDTAIAKIKEKEEAILQSGGLAQVRKDLLSPYFQMGIQNKNITDLLTYYTYLSEFEGAIARNAVQDDELIDGLIKGDKNTKDIKEVYTALKEETGDNRYFSDIKDNLAASAADAAQLEGDYTSYTDKVDSFIGKYNQYLNEEQAAVLSDLETLQVNASGITEKLREGYKQAEVEAPAADALQGEMFVSMQDTAAGELKSISGLINSLSERQGNIEEYTRTLQSKVGSVQGRADTLNGTWAANVDTTKKIKKDVYGLLNNTLVDNQQNPYVYDYLASPVNVDGKVMEDKVVNTPPVVMLIVILLSGLVIGYFLYHYSSMPLFVHLSLFILLNVAVGLIISIYGLNLYALGDVQAIKWTAFTILLLMACSSAVRFAFTIGPFIGWIAAAGLILFFITPLMDIVLPNFDFNHPVSNVYMSIQYGDQSKFAGAAVVLGIIAAVLTAMPYISRGWPLKKQRELAADEV